MKRSYSQLQTYQACPRQFEFAYVKKLPRGGISAGESFGTSMHNCLKKFGELERVRVRARENQLQLFLENPDPVPSPTPLSCETLLDLWHQSFIVEGYASRIDADEARRRGEEILKLYFDWWQQQAHEVLAVEKGFNLQFGDLKLSGRFDRVEETADGIHIIDYKTSKPRTQAEVDEDLQLSIYAIACQEVFGKPCTRLCFLFLNEEGVTQVETQRTPEQLQQAAQTIQSLDKQILNAMFEPTPSVAKCGRCPYKNVCDRAVRG